MLEINITSQRTSWTEGCQILSDNIQPFLQSFYTQKGEMYNHPREIIIRPISRIVLYAKGLHEKRGFNEL